MTFLIIDNIYYRVLKSFSHNYPSSSYSVIITCKDTVCEDNNEIYIIRETSNNFDNITAKRVIKLDTLKINHLLYYDDIEYNKYIFSIFEYAKSCNREIKIENILNDNNYENNFI